MPRKKAAAVIDPPRPTLVFTSSTWKARLSQELIAAGLTHDTANLVAVRVLKGIVAGPLDSPGPDGRDGNSL